MFFEKRKIVQISLHLTFKWLLTRLENHFESKQICFYSNLDKVFQLLEFQAKLFFEPIEQVVLRETAS